MIARILGFSILLGCPSALGEVVKYEDLPRLISEKNYQVRSGKAQVSAATARTGYFARSYLPHLDAQAGYERFKLGSTNLDTNPYWNIRASINLFRGGVDYLGSEVNDLREKASEASLDEIKRSNLLTARKLYWSLATLQKMFLIQEQAIGENEKHLKTANRRVSAGIATKSDPIEFKLERTLLEQELKKMTLEKDKLRNQLAVVLAKDDHENLKVEADLSHPPESELTEESIEINQIPVVARNRLSTEIFDRQATIESRYWTPQVDIYTEYGRYSARDFQVQSATEWVAGVRVKMNLFDGLESQRKASQNRALAMAAEAQATHSSMSFKALTHELHHDLKLLHDLLHDAESSVAQSKNFLKLTLQEYRQGAKNGPDVLSASKKTIEFEKRFYELLRDFYIVKSELRSLKGE